MPGAAAVTSMVSGIQVGFKRSIPAVIGLKTGILLHLILVNTGVGALIATSETLFNLLKWLGVLFLFYLGIMKWNETSEITSDCFQNPCNYQILTSSLLVNLVNPKVIIFQIAFLPQFIDLNYALLPQYLIIGTTQLIVDFLVMLSYAGFASKIIPLITRQQNRQNQIFGCLYIFCGALLSTISRR